MSIFQNLFYRRPSNSSSAKPRILFYTLHYPPGVGGSIFYEEGLRKALLENYHITVITPNRGYAGLKPTNGELNTQSGVWEIRRKYMVLPDFFLPKKWTRRFKKIVEVLLFPVDINFLLYSQRYDHIFIGTPTIAGCLTAFFARLYKIPVTSVFYGEELGPLVLTKKEKTLTINRLRIIFTIQNSTRFLVPSLFTEKMLRQAYRKNLPGPVKMVYPFIDEKHFHNKTSKAEARNILHLDPQKKYLLTVSSRDQRRKGIDKVLQSLPSITKKNPEVLYLVVGINDYQSLMDIAKANHVEEYVRFIPKVKYSMLPYYYSACDIYIMPTREIDGDVEGFGFVFLEASSCQRVSIGGNSGGVPEAVLHEKTGLIVNSEIEEISSAVIRLFSDVAFADELAKNAYLRSQEEFSKIAAHKKFVQELIFLNSRDPAVRIQEQKPSVKFTQENI